MNKSWDSLSLSEKSEIMRVAIHNGITDLSTIRQKYNEFAEGGPEKILDKVNSSKANFVQRLKDPDRKYIKDWASESIATHKLGVGTDEHGNNYIYPEVQEINGKLVDFTRPPYSYWAGQVSAEERGDTVRVQNLEDAIKFTEEYKKYYPKGNTFLEDSNLFPNGGFFHRLIRFTPRKRENTSPTKKKSEMYEDLMARAIIKHQRINGGSDPDYDIAFKPDKKILIGSTTTSTNALDSLVKYAAIHNANPQLSQHTILSKGEYDTPRKVNMNEMLGLAFQETSNGARPHVNSKKSKNPRALANSNYFTAYENIPADDFVNDYHYNAAGVSRDVPPLLDAFQYFAQGDYNRNDPNHTKDVNNSGKRAWKNPNVLAWWNTSDPNAGKNLYDYWYNKTKEKVKRKK